MPTSRRVITGMRWCLFAVPILLQACAPQAAGPAGPRNPVFAADLAGGAKQCTASKPELKDGQETTATLEMRNDGGWCALSVAQDGKPFAAGLLTTPASHGRVFIHPVGDETRIDYTPEHGFAGSDAFVVKLIPGNATIRVAVTVAP